MTSSRLSRQFSSARSVFCLFVCFCDCFIFLLGFEGFTFIFATWEKKSGYIYTYIYKLLLMFEQLHSDSISSTDGPNRSLSFTLIPQVFMSPLRGNTFCVLQLFDSFWFTGFSFSFSIPGSPVRCFLMLFYSISDILICDYFPAYLHWTN